MSTTDLLIEYCERTKHINFPENVEAAIEKDYPKNHALYTDSMLGIMSMLYQLHREIDPEELIRLATEMSTKPT